MHFIGAICEHRKASKAVLIIYANYILGLTPRMKLSQRKFDSAENGWHDPGVVSNTHEPPIRREFKFD